MMTRFLWLNLGASLFGGSLLLVHRLTQTQFSCHWRYLSYFSIWFLLVTLFLPLDLFPSLTISLPVSGEAGILSAEAALSSSGTYTAGGFSDLAVNGVRWDWQSLYCLGLLVRLGLLMADGLMLWRMYRHSVLIEKTEGIEIHRVAGLRSPCSFGWLHPVILLPEKLALTAEERTWVLAHEKAHLDLKHWPVNLGVSLLVAIYWCNPLIAYFYRRFRLEQEMQCDLLAMTGQPSEIKAAYARLLVTLASRGSLHLESRLSIQGRRMYQRIEQLFASPARHSGKVWLVCLVGLGCLLTPIQAIGQTPAYQTDLVLQEIDLTNYFGQKQGCAVFYDSSQDQYWVYRREAALQRVSPNSTYKIFLALHALEDGHLDPEAMLVNQEDQIYPYVSWNQPQNLNTAMRDSVNWYFSQADAVFSRQQIQAFLEKIGYGNASVEGSLASYWLEGSLLISPLETVLLLRQFDMNSWHFQSEHIAAVKEAIRLEASLYGKTGSGMVNGQPTGGWFIGYQERPEGSLYFAVYLEHASGSEAYELALSILEKEEIVS